MMVSLGTLNFIFGDLEGHLDITKRARAFSAGQGGYAWGRCCWCSSPGIIGKVRPG